MPTRRDFILASLATALLPGAVMAGISPGKPLPWLEFLHQVKQLASDYSNRIITQQEMAARGTRLLQQLDLADSAFKEAIRESYESGNRFWLWQRLTKETGVKGGILNIERDQDVPLHDHPGATGMVRVLTGELEVWQFDLPDLAEQKPEDPTILQRASHRILKPGDIAVLSPDKGNIHALKARSNKCSMLDYFIPPYERSERTWYMPVDSDWHDRNRIACKSISENDFYMS